jgi:hypothetical protein
MSLFSGRFTKLFFVSTIFLYGALYAQSQVNKDKFTISGYIKDGSNGESLLAASVYVTELNKGTNTNEYGFYSITLPKGNYTLKVSYVGFSTTEKKIELSGDLTFNVEMGTNEVQTEEVGNYR